MHFEQKQECIPVGCVPTGTVATTKCQYLVFSVQRGSLSKGGLYVGEGCLPACPLWTE